ncbi:MAG: hypothetical protein WBM44_11480 [Waterburya sp.]
MLIRRDDTHGEFVSESSFYFSLVGSRLAIADENSVVERQD